MVFVNFLFSICEYMYIYAFNSTMIITGYTLHTEENNLSSVVYMIVLIMVFVDRIQCKKLCLCLSFCLFRLSVFLSVSVPLSLYPSLSCQAGVNFVSMILSVLGHTPSGSFWCPSSNHCQSQLCHRFALVHKWHLVHSRQLRLLELPALGIYLPAVYKAYAKTNNTRIIWIMMELLHI